MTDQKKQHYELEDFPVPGNSSNIPLYNEAESEHRPDSEKEKPYVC